MSRHKAAVETMINTAALTLTSFGVIEITRGNYYGFLVVSFGMVLEFIKYWCRYNKYF